MNGDTVENIARFLEGQEDKLPPRVTNGMILVALREVCDQLKCMREVLHGERSDGADGLINRLEKLEATRGLLLWLVTPVVLAFLGGLGAFLVDRLLN